MKVLDVTSSLVGWESSFLIKTYKIFTLKKDGIQLFDTESVADSS